MLSQPVTDCITAVSTKNIMPRIRPFVTDRLFRLDVFVAILFRVTIFWLILVYGRLETPSYDGAGKNQDQNGPERLVCQSLSHCRRAKKTLGKQPNKLGKHRNRIGCRWFSSNRKQPVVRCVFLNTNGGWRKIGRCKCCYYLIKHLLLLDLLTRLDILC